MKEWKVVVAQFGRAVASDTRGPGSNPVNGKIYIEHYLLSIVLKDENKRKEEVG